MKSLLVSAFIFFNSCLFAGELESIEVITPMAYRSNETSFGSYITSKTITSLATNKMITDRVIKGLSKYSSQLDPYFPEKGGVLAFAKKVADEGAAKHLQKNNDENTLDFMRLIGNNLIGVIADRLLESKGVTDSQRRKLWVNKIMTPFNNCMGVALDALNQGNRCIEALTASMIPTVGVGLVYELSKSNLESALPEGKRNQFNTNQVNNYKKCIAKTQASPDDVEKCALGIMREGVVYVTDLTLTKTLQTTASSAAKANTINQSVSTPFKACVDKSSASEQFIGCIDTLMQSTGMLLVEDKVNNTPTIKQSFSKIEIGKLSNENVKGFKQCMEQVKKENVRKNGLLDTNVCENKVTNDVTYKVVTKLLEQTISDTFKDDPKIAKDMSGAGGRTLDLCWKSNQLSKERESCLRTTILTFSGALARVKLDKAVPAELKDLLIGKSLKSLNACMEKTLPENISEASDLTTKISFCTDTLTHDVAMTVATESLKLEAQKNKFSEEETNNIVSKLVTRTFATCIGKTPNDSTLDKCAGNLKRNAALNLAEQKIRSNAQEKMAPKEVDLLVNKLVNQNFSQCVGSNPTDAVLDHCVGELTKDATKSIVLSYVKLQLKEQLNADSTPDPIKPVENQFIACTEKKYSDKDVSKAIDECTKQFALGFAKSLGELKMTTLMKSILGTENYMAQKKTIDQMLFKYNSCLDDLKRFSIEDGLLDKLETCTTSLQNNGERFVASTVNEWMTSEQKDAATGKIKREFAGFLPCLSVLMPTSPYSPQLDENVKSVLRPVAKILAEYIEYDPDNAKHTLDQVIKKLQTDLKDVATNPQSRRALIEMLYQNGALDQFLKSMIRGQVKESFETTSEEDLPNDLRNTLLSKDNFDHMFATEEGKVIKDIVMEKILKPMLMDQASMSSPIITAAMDTVKDKVVKMLVYSPNFGDLILKSSIQSKIDNMGGFTKFFAKAIYGKNALDWEKVRATSSGKEAEEYIREKVLMPKFKGESSQFSDEKKIMEEAEKLVKAAVKNYEE